MKIILASSSPRRIKLLDDLGLEFSVIKNEIKESEFDEENPADLVKTLAQAKAKDVAEKVDEGLVIGADTIVVLENKILEKPEDAREAKEMLRKLNNRTHTVMTGLAVINASTGSKTVSCVNTEVSFRKLTEKEISDYVSTGEPLDKAGAYGIQGIGGVFVEKINGCYYSVVGLPLSRLAEILNSYGVSLV